MKVIEVISDTSKVGEGGSEFRIILDEGLPKTMLSGAEELYSMVTTGNDWSDVIQVIRRDDTADGEPGADNYWVYVCRLWTGMAKSYCDANDLLGKELVMLKGDSVGPREYIRDSHINFEMPGELTLKDVEKMLSDIYFSRPAIEERVEAPIIRVFHDEEEGTILVEIKGTFSVMTGIGGLKRYLGSGAYSKIFYNDIELKDADMKGFKRWVNGEQ